MTDSELVFNLNSIQRHTFYGDADAIPYRYRGTEEVGLRRARIPLIADKHYKASNVTVAIE